MRQDHQPKRDQYIKEVRALHCFLPKRALAESLDDELINEHPIKLLETTTQQRK